MNDQSKIPGAMVLVSRETVLRVLDDAAYINQVDRQTLRDAVAEQTPASPMAERIRQAMITDSSQDGVNIAEGRFGKEMAALCVQLDGQTPAVDGDLHTFFRQLLDALDLAGHEKEFNASTGRYKYNQKAFDLMANHVAPLLARIAELEAQQGEPVYQTCNGVDGWIDVDRIRYTASQLAPEECECRVLYRYARPATAKVVLPGRMTIQAEASGFKNGELKGWNACLDEVARLNP